MAFALHNSPLAPSKDFLEVPRYPSHKELKVLAKDLALLHTEVCSAKQTIGHLSAADGLEVLHQQYVAPVREFIFQYGSSLDPLTEIVLRKVYDTLQEQLSTKSFEEVVGKSLQQFSRKHFADVVNKALFMPLQERERSKDVIRPLFSDIASLLVDFHIFRKETFFNSFSREYLLHISFPLEPRVTSFILQAECLKKAIQSLANESNDYRLFYPYLRYALTLSMSLTKPCAILILGQDELAESLSLHLQDFLSFEYISSRAIKESYPYLNSEEVILDRTVEKFHGALHEEVSTVVYFHICSNEVVTTCERLLSRTKAIPLLISAHPENDLSSCFSEVLNKLYHVAS